MCQTIQVITAVLAILLLCPSFGWTGLFPSLPYPGPFEGRVLNRDTKQPIPGARIHCHWSCADLPIPHAPGEFHIYEDAAADAKGFFRIEESTRRGGFSGCSFSISCKANGYIEIVLIGDPDEVALPPSTQAWPFVETRVQRTIPKDLDFKMKPALPVFLQALESKNELYRQIAAEELGHIGPEAKPAVPSLISAASDPNPDVRRKAVEALGLIDPMDRSAVSALIQALADPDAETRENSLKSLAQSGPAAARSVPDLVAVFHDKNPVVRRRVPAALVAVGAQDPRVVLALVGALQDADSRTVQEASNALADMGEDSLPEMVEFLCHEDSNVRKIIARILIAKNQAGELRRAIQTRDPAERLAAVKHLGCLAREKEEFIRVLVDLLSDERSEIREAAVATLAEIGDTAQPYLLEALQTGDPRMYSAAAEAHISGESAERESGPDATRDLIQAVMRGSPSEVVSMFSLGADVNAVGERGFTPLMAAAGRRRVEIINLLLALGAEIDAVDDFGRTALMCAARAGNEAGARILLALGSDIDRRDAFDQTALVYAARSNAIGMMEILLNHGTNGETNAGEDVKSLGEALYYAALDGRTEAAEFLLDHGASIEARNSQGETPLMAAARFGQNATLKFLLDRGAEVDARNRYGWTPLMAAAGAGELEAAGLLVSRGALVEAKSDFKETPLMFAAREGRREVASYLLDIGADPGARDRSGKTARDLAAANGHPEVAGMLK